MKKEISKKFIQKAPQESGIYIFKDKNNQPIYIGKAINLKSRISQYFNAKTYAPFLKHLLDEAEKIDFQTTDSDIEALILESQLIKKIQPRYNIMLRDDKKYFYVGITKEEFPRIFLTHQPYKFKTQITNFKSNLNVLKFKIENWNLPSKIEYIGPFTDGSVLKFTLRFLRKIFPYCTCKQKHNNFCLNYHIGKCLGICCLKQQSRNSQFSILNFQKISGDYKRNIKSIKDILSGKRESLIKNLKKELNQLGKKQEFEKAIELRNKIEKLERIFENAKIIKNNPNLRMYANDANTLNKLKRIFNLPTIPHRIEGYDISNIQGTNATGSMVVFINGEPDKNEYRKFKIRTKFTPDDTAMLKEVLKRRFNYPEWQYPDLILIDGGKAQLNAARSAISQIQIPIISLAKGKQEVFSNTVKNPIPMVKILTQVRNLILYIDSEAHRFAISYYRKLHRRSI